MTWKSIHDGFPPRNVSVLVRAARSKPSIARVVLTRGDDGRTHQRWTNNFCFWLGGITEWAWLPDDMQDEEWDEELYKQIEQNLVTPKQDVPLQHQD